MVGADDALCVDICGVGCCYFDCVCWAEGEVLDTCCYYWLGWAVLGWDWIGSVGVGVSG